MRTPPRHLLNAGRRTTRRPVDAGPPRAKPVEERLADKLSAARPRRRPAHPGPLRCCVALAAMTVPSTVRWRSCRLRSWTSR